MTDKKKKGLGASIEKVAKMAGVTPQRLLEDALRNVFLQTPIEELQELGFVKDDDKRKRVSRAKAAKDVVGAVGQSFKTAVLANQWRRIEDAYGCVLHERMFAGLGADFVSPLLLKAKDGGCLAMQLLAARKRLAKIVKKGDDPKRPYFWEAEMPLSLAKHELDKIDRDIAVLDKKYTKVGAAKMKAYRDRMKREVEKLAKRTAKVKCPFDWLTRYRYYVLCNDVLEDMDFSDPKAKCSFPPYDLLTRESLIGLLAERVRKIKSYEREMNGPHDRMVTKADFKFWIRTIKLELKEFPADIVKAAKAQA